MNDLEKMQKYSQDRQRIMKDVTFDHGNVGFKVDLKLIFKIVTINRLSTAFG